MLKIYNAGNVLEAELVTALLRENNIPSYYRNAAGNVTAHGVDGFGLFGVDIFVDEEHAGAAKIIIGKISEEAFESGEEFTSGDEFASGEELPGDGQPPR